MRGCLLWAGFSTTGIDPILRGLYPPNIFLIDTLVEGCPQMEYCPPVEDCPPLEYFSLVEDCPPLKGFPPIGVEDGLLVGTDPMGVGDRKHHIYYVV